MTNKIPWKHKCSKELPTHQLLLRYSKPGLGSPLMNVWLSWSSVKISKNCIPCFTCFLKMCLLQDVNSSSKVIARTIAPAFYSWIETWIVVLPNWRPTTLSMIITSSIINRKQFTTAMSWTNNLSLCSLQWKVSQPILRQSFFQE